MEPLKTQRLQTFDTPRTAETILGSRQIWDEAAGQVAAPKAPCAKDKTGSF
jgi:hypothetical protein